VVILKYFLLWDGGTPVVFLTEEPLLFSQN
jgi:hypothetical protein